VTRLEQLEDEICYTAYHLMEENVKCRQVEGVKGIYPKVVQKYRDEYREKLRELVMTWIAELTIIKAKQKLTAVKGDKPKVVGRW